MDDRINDTVKEFLAKNCVTDKAIGSLAYRIRQSEEINPVIDHYYIPGAKVKKDVSIAEIMGYSYTSFQLQNNIIPNLSYFFDEKGSGYQTRSLGFLELDSEEMLKLSKEICKKDFMCVKECDKGKYVITNNGMHRFNVLRFHFVNELSKIVDPMECEALKKKYSFTFEVQQMDFIKTYSYFILRKIYPDLRMRVQYDADYNPTGKAELTFDDNDVEILDDKGLIGLLEKEISLNRDLLKIYEDMFDCYSENIPSFHDFLEEHGIDLFVKGVDDD